MNPETVVKLIVMVCEVIKRRSGGTGLEAKVADKVLAEVAGLLPHGNQRQNQLPSGRRLLADGREPEEGANS